MGKKKSLGQQLYESYEGKVPYLIPWKKTKDEYRLVNEEAAKELHKKWCNEECDLLEKFFSELGGLEGVIECIRKREHRK